MADEHSGDDLFGEEDEVNLVPGIQSPKLPRPKKLIHSKKKNKILRMRMTEYLVQSIVIKQMLILIG